MALPSTGNQISFNQIRIELGISGQAPFDIETAENGGYVAINECASPVPSSANPASINEWWSYNHTAASSLVFAGGFDYSVTSCAEACALELDCSTTLYYNAAETAVYTTPTCDTLPLIGYYADCDRTNCYDIDSGIINGISAC